MNSGNGPERTVRLRHGMPDASLISPAEAKSLQACFREIQASKPMLFHLVLRQATVTIEQDKRVVFCFDQDAILQSFYNSDAAYLYHAIQRHFGRDYSVDGAWAH